MPNSYHVDDNGKSGVTGLRGTYTTAGIVTATTGGATVEAPLGASFASNQSTFGKTAIVRLVVLTNPCLYAFNAAGQGASHTGNTNMTILPVNTVEYVKINSSDVSLYHQQITGAGTLQVTVLQ